MSLNEQWRSVPGHPLYEVSNAGRVRSLHQSPSRLVHPWISHGYAKVSLIRGRHLFVHRLVAMAFLTQPSSRHVVNHLNGVRHDNRVENLEWVTQQENLLHSVHVLGNPPDCFISKLSDVQKEEIGTRLAYGESASALGREFGVASSTIARYRITAEEPLPDGESATALCSDSEPIANQIAPEVRAYFQALGQKGGKIGGKRSLETMTPAERRARAKKAGQVGAAVRRAKAKARRDTLKRTTERND